MSTALSVQRLARHLPPTFRPVTLRGVLRRSSGPFTLSAGDGKFSVLIQNMGLLVAPGNYLGTDRNGAIDQICSEIRRLSPDVVGLCEVFANDERDRIRGAVRDTYPYYRQGPDEADLESDGGLLVLSKHPLLAAGFTIYRDCDGPDCFANKGMIHIRVQGPGWPSAIDLFHTHAQDISTDDGEQALYHQLFAMYKFMYESADPALPAIVMGDINVPAEVPRHYQELLKKLIGVRDCWTIAGNPFDGGFTSIRDSSFHEDHDDRPDRDSRLDYVLMRPGTRAIPILSSIEVLRFTRNGRLISDHLALFATFEKMAILQP